MKIDEVVTPALDESGRKIAPTERRLGDVSALVWRSRPVCAHLSPDVVPVAATRRRVLFLCGACGLVGRSHDARLLRVSQPRTLGLLREEIET